MSDTDERTKLNLLVIWVVNYMGTMIHGEKDMGPNVDNKIKIVIHNRNTNQFSLVNFVLTLRVKVEIRLDTV